MSALKINNENFESVISGERPVLIDFYADWCGPCKMMAPIIEELASEAPYAAVGKVNVDDCPELARKFKIYSIPTLVVIKNGAEIQRAVGVRTKEALIDMIG